MGKPNLTILDNSNPSNWFNDEVKGLQGGNWSVQGNPIDGYSLEYECSIANIASIDDQANDFVVPRNVPIPNFIRKELRKTDGKIWIWTEYKSVFDFSSVVIPNYPFVSQRDESFYGADKMCIAPGRYDLYFNRVKLYGTGEYVLRVTVNSDRIFPDEDYNNDTKILPFHFDEVSEKVIYDPLVLPKFIPSPVTGLVFNKDKNQIVLNWSGNGLYYRVKRNGLDVVTQSPFFSEKFPSGNNVIYSVSAGNEFGESIAVNLQITKGK